LIAPTPSQWPDQISSTLLPWMAASPRKIPADDPAHSPSRNLRSDVVIQVAREMQHEVAKAVAEREGLGPELLVAQRRRQSRTTPASFL
jgi:hypothetical protein